MFEYRLELADGSPVEPQPFVTITPTWNPATECSFREREYRIVEAREGVLVVERDQATDPETRLPAGPSPDAVKFL